MRLKKIMKKHTKMKRDDQRTRTSLKQRFSVLKDGYKKYILDK